MAARGDSNTRIAGERQKPRQKWERGLQLGHDYGLQRDCRPLYKGYTDILRPRRVAWAGCTNPYWMSTKLINKVFLKQSFEQSFVKS